MTRAGATLDDIPSRIPWRSLASFITHLDPSSAYMRELSPDLAPWLGSERVQGMLADLIDAVQILDWHFTTANTKKGSPKPKKPKPYPRPWKQGGDEMRIGRDPIPASEFDDWWEGGG